MIEIKPFCEIIVSSVLPALRALIAKELIQTYNLNQSEVAKKLGITQPAISHYKRELRGQRVKLLQSNKEIMDVIKKLSADIASGDVKATQIVKRFCDICKMVRKEKIICKMHENAYPGLDSCDICFK